tara:strand:+ start:251 stop:511 length:261 start_codon:yes stop_codon:yes gene_type:complete
VGNLIKWVGGLILLVAGFYILFLIVNQQIQDRNLKRSQFKCSFIEGKCTKKATYKNCKQFGSVPDHVCEFKLNRDLKTIQSLESKL